MTHSPTQQAERSVVIVDDHVLFAQALELALRQEGYDANRAEFPNAPSSWPLVSGILQAKPSVLLLDLDLGPHGDGLSLVAPVARAGIDVMVVTGTEERVMWARALAAGARTVMSKTRPLPDVVGAVQRLMRGLPVSSRAERDQLLAELRSQRQEQQEIWDRFDQLTMRESEVLGLLMQGHSVRGIAEHGFVAEATVRTQVKSILGKLAVSSQLAAVGLAYQIGWRAPFDRPLRS